MQSALSALEAVLKEDNIPIEPSVLTERQGPLDDREIFSNIALTMILIFTTDDIKVRFERAAGAFPGSLGGMEAELEEPTTAIAASAKQESSTS